MLSKVLSVGFFLMLMSVGTIGQNGEYNYTYPPDRYDPDGKVLRNSYHLFSELINSGQLENAFECGDCIHRQDPLKRCDPDYDINDPENHKKQIYILEYANCGVRCENNCKWDAKLQLATTPELKTKLQTYVLEQWVENYKTNKTVSRKEKARLLDMYKKTRKLCLSDCNSRCGGDLGCEENCKKTCGSINAGFYSYLSPSLLIFTLFITLLSPYFLD